MSRKELSLTTRRTAVGMSASARRCIRRREEGGPWSEGLDALEIIGGGVGGTLYDEIERSGARVDRGPVAPTDRAAAEFAAEDRSLDRVEDIYRAGAVDLAEDAIRFMDRAGEASGWARVGLGVLAAGAFVLALMSGVNAGVFRGYAAAARVPVPPKASAPALQTRAGPRRVDGGR